MDALLGFVIYVIVALLFITAGAAFYGFKFVSRHKLLEKQYKSALGKVLKNPRSRKLRKKAFRVGRRYYSDFMTKSPLDSVDEAIHPESDVRQASVFAKADVDLARKGEFPPMDHRKMDDDEEEQTTLTRAKKQRKDAA